MRNYRLIGLLLCLPLASCTYSIRTLRWNTPDDEAFRYSFETEHHLQTTVETLPPGAGDIDAIAQKLADATFSLHGVIEKFKALYFNDGTAGVVVRFVSVDGSQSGPEEAPIDVAGLVGKSVAMRIFDSGEIFETLGYEHFAGYGRYGELFAELFTQLFTRLPYELPEEGKSMFVRSTIPLAIDASTMVKQEWEVNYHREGETVPCELGRNCVTLVYEGTITEKSANRDPRHFTLVEGTGQVSGSILFALDRGDFEEHRYSIDMNRTLKTYDEPFVKGKEEAPPRAVVQQSDQSTTVIRREP